MAKKNYTRAQARRAVNLMRNKTLKLYVDGYMSVKCFTKLGDEYDRIDDRLLKRL